MSDHGTNSRYAKGCRCDECRHAHAVAEKKWRLAKERGVRLRVGTPEVLAMIVKQREKYGLNLHELARASGIARKTLQRAYRADGKGYFESITLRRLVDLPFLSDDVRRRAPATATLIRLDAARAIGWGEIAKREFDVNLPSRGLVASRGDSFMLIDTIERCIKYLQFAMLDPKPDSFLARQARAKGALPPEAWDRDLLFDPYWDGRGGRIGLDAEGRDLWNELLFLQSQGLTLDEALKRLNRNSDWYYTVRKRYEKEST